MSTSNKTVFPRLGDVPKLDNTVRGRGLEELLRQGMEALWRGEARNSPKWHYIIHKHPLLKQWDDMKTHCYVKS